MSRRETLIGTVEAVVDGAGRLGAWLVVALVLVMSANVLLRYLFSAGSVWAQELEWHLLAPICLLGLAYSVQMGEHVRVDILYGRYPARAKAAVDLAASALFVLVCGLVIVLSWRYVAQSWRMGEGSANPGGIPYRWALKALIPLGFALLLLQSAADLLKAWRRWRA